MILTGWSHFRQQNTESNVSTTSSIVLTSSRNKVQIPPSESVIQVSIAERDRIDHGENQVGQSLQINTYKNQNDTLTVSSFTSTSRHEHSGSVPFETNDSNQPDVSLTVTIHEQQDTHHTKLPLEQISINSISRTEQTFPRFQSLTSLVRPPALLEESKDMFDLLPEEYLPDYKSFCWFDARSKLQCLPSVYLAGMPKCGSTDLYDKIVWHPEITQPTHWALLKKKVPSEKEFPYWARMRLGRQRSYFNKHIGPKMRFSTFLAGTGAEKLHSNKELRIIDGAPCLFFDIEGWEERYPGYEDPPYTNADLIHTVTPDAKVVVIFRNPTERLLSNYVFHHKNSNAKDITPQTFHSEVQKEIENFHICLKSRPLRHCCFSDKHSQKLRIAVGIYICFATDWAQLFKENFLAITLKEYYSDTVGTMLKVYNHIGLHEPDVADLTEFIDKSRTKNSNTANKEVFGQMLEKTRELLNNFYEPYNIDLADYLGDSKFLFK